MKNITELREELTLVFNDLKSGGLKPSEACELNNSAGKILNSLKIQVEYQKLRGEKPSIGFLDK